MMYISIRMKKIDQYLIQMDMRNGMMMQMKICTIKGIQTTQFTRIIGVKLLISLVIGYKTLFQSSLKMS